MGLITETTYMGPARLVYRKLKEHDIYSDYLAGLVKDEDGLKQETEMLPVAETTGLAGVFFAQISGIEFEDKLTTETAQELIAFLNDLGVSLLIPDHWQGEIKAVELFLEAFSTVAATKERGLLERVTQPTQVYA